MKRSAVNRIVDETKEFFQSSGCLLPQFANWTYQDWLKKDLSLYQEIFDVSLGWDVTDLGSQDFEKTGLTLFTIRNGSFLAKVLYPKPYAEKILICRKNQIVPYHFHWYKMEDIINRGRGTLLLQLYQSTPDEDFDKKNKVYYKLDGFSQSGGAGCVVSLKPGESITLPTGLYHSFWTEDSSMLLVAEVSACNDDANDNRFHTFLPRFSTIEEDETIRWVLCNEYETFLNIKKQ